MPFPFQANLYYLTEQQKQKCIQGIKQRKNINASSCFDGVLNNEEYSKDLKYYTKTHRSKKKDYDVDKYFTNISAVGRYYKELYGEEKSLIFPKSKNTLSKTLTNSPNKIGILSLVLSIESKQEIKNKKILINNGK